MCVDQLLLDTAQHMADSKEKVEIVDQLQMCKTNCSFMSVAINRTVDFAKSASGIALAAKMEPASITDSMQWAVTCLNSSQPNVSIEMLPLPAGICDYIVTDRHWLMENVLCYLSNAVKYSAGGHVTVSASLVDGDGSSVASTSSPIGVDHNKVIGEYSPIPSSARSSGRKRNIFTRVLEIHPGSGAIVSEVSMSSAEEYESRRPLMQQLRITVEDEGIGISDEKKSTLFKPFQQTMRLAGGTGLGLFSLSKRIEVLKGKFGVENKPDGKQGSCFWFSIPYTPDEISANVTSPIVRHRESIEETSSPIHMVKNGAGDIIDDNAPTALVVDDSVVIAKSTKRMLMNAGYKVDVADNGAIGLEMMKEKVYTIVIMDLQMPVMDGLEATRRIRVYEGDAELQISEVRSSVRSQFIIGASANGADDVMRDALESGMDVFVEKPFSVSILAECQRQAKREAPDNLV
jgi:CheY-like chemotaxis protein/signal transduction histidine kinase